MLGLKRAPVGVTYRALKLSQTIVEPAHFKYAHSFLLRSPAKSFVVQAPTDTVCKAWEHGEHQPRVWSTPLPVAAAFSTSLPVVMSLSTPLPVAIVFRTANVPSAHVCVWDVSWVYW